ncbi:MAG: chromate efflux transporter [Hyphomicrobiaceae bacterium]|nr:chromate efflux transporter [Hyphomicrobiaceae bacterium]
MTHVTTAANGDAASAPTLAQAIRIWAKVGILSFGGPTAQIALMHKVIVEENKWLSEQQFLNALGFCMLLPGPEAMQLATYSGWRLHGIIGGLAAGLLFVLPGAGVILALATLYAYLGNVPFVTALFLGIKAAVLVIVIEALVRVSKRALQSGEHWIIAILAFVGLFFLDLPFPLIVIAAALFGFLRGRNAEGARAEKISHGQPLSRTLQTIGIWLAIWWIPLLAVGFVASNTVLPDIGFFFSKLAVVTFGGAYAVLAYMAQDVVNHFGWLTAGEMLDGLGLAETTPGPLILVTEFVGFLAAFREGGFALGLAGAIVTLWVTFAPCFLWIFAGAPYIDWIGSQPRLKGALAAITAAVVGVILNLSVWFALHVFFTEVSPERHGPVTLWTPDFATLDWRVILLAGFSAFLLFARHWSLWQILLTASLAGAALSYAVA